MMTDSSRSSGAMPEWVRQTLPILLLLFSPPFVMVLWYTNVELGGSFLELGRAVLREGLPAVLWEIWAPRFFGSPTAWGVIALFVVLELLLLKVLPGKRVYGTITPAGEVPDYPDNGLPAFALTLVLWVLGGHVFGLFSPTVLYDHLGELLGALNLVALVFCVFLYIKGRAFPSSADASLTGNPVFDYYWGTELHPRVLGWDIKQVTNCRLGMMGWPLLILSFAAKQAEVHGLSDSMAVAVGLQLVYIAKFFVWEAGYLRSMDIQHDRAGFYICWGCLVWLPCIYTSHTLYLVGHPNSLGAPLAALIGLVGLGAIAVNYLADRQRQLVRATEGRCLVWGRKPMLIHAEYRTSRGELKQSILLASGYWGLSRHFHYLPELLAAFCWTVPALFGHFAPWFYLTFLTILLVHRSIRDDRRCAAKYGPAWQEYRELVPNRILPSFGRFRR